MSGARWWLLGSANWLASLCDRGNSPLMQTRTSFSWVPLQWQTKLYTLKRYTTNFNVYLIIYLIYNTLHSLKTVVQGCARKRRLDVLGLHVSRDSFYSAAFVSSGVRSGRPERNWHLHWRG